MNCDCSGEVGFSQNRLSRLRNLMFRYERV